MKNVDSARTERRLLPDGRLHLHIRHDVLRGVTPAMLVWWFRHLEGTIEVGGRYARRLPDGSVGPGAKIHIREAWLRHNVEEVGNFEHFLPALYAREATEPPSSSRSGES